ncbi:MAG: NUDIX domain-containing protein [Streptosporangiaceae bacterium]
MTVKHSIECWVFGPDQRVLLLQVPAQPGKHEAFWQPITGGMENAETAPQAALRELSEETGLQVAERDLTEVATGLEVVISPELTISKTLYVAQAPHGEVIVNPHEHQAHQWLPPTEVAGVLFWESNRETWKLVGRHHRLGVHDNEA